MSSPWRQLVVGLRTWCGAAPERDVDDRQLLECFARERDAQSFAALLDRHGPMVWGVCLRVLGNGPDAEDAFQATFLILLRQAGQHWHESITGWLYRVAQRTATRARVQATRRRIHEHRAGNTMNSAATNAERDECLAALDDELARLPDMIRLPLVLCFLRGQTREQAALEL
ncbi:MAG: RNA polymerase sigma factor, partial [Gemmataceae bacterium]